MTATAGSVALSLAELERFDPNVPAAGTQHRFCCPLDACSGKPINETHRSLCVNTATGLWKCHRCGATGKLQDFWDERKPSRLARGRRELLRAFDLATPTPPLPETAATWGTAWK